MGESISAWTWPNKDVLKATINTMSDRSDRLNIKISGIEDQAELYASSAEELAKLTREAKIAEATYTVLMNSEITISDSRVFFRIPKFSILTVPSAPSSPRTFLLLALSTNLGVFVGFISAFINGFRKDVLFQQVSKSQVVKTNVQVQNTYAFQSTIFKT